MPQQSPQRVDRRGVGDAVDARGAEMALERGDHIPGHRVVEAADRDAVAVTRQHRLQLLDLLETFLVTTLGKFPLPVEVIPMARSYVARELEALAGRPVWRANYVTDNGNLILDVHGLTIDDPAALERTINQIAGVVTVGLFAVRPADVLLMGTPRGVEIL